MPGSALAESEALEMPASPDVLAGTTFTDGNPGPRRAPNTRREGRRLSSYKPTSSTTLDNCSLRCARLRSQHYYRADHLGRLRVPWRPDSSSRACRVTTTLTQKGYAILDRA